MVIKAAVKGFISASSSASFHRIYLTFRIGLDDKIIRLGPILFFKQSVRDEREHSQKKRKYH